MMLSTPAAHAPFTPAPKYKNNFPDKQAPRTPSFNIHGKVWVAVKDQTGQTIIDP